MRVLSRPGGSGAGLAALRPGARRLRLGRRAGPSASSLEEAGSLPARRGAPAYAELAAAGARRPTATTWRCLPSRRRGPARSHAPAPWPMPGSSRRRGRLRQRPRDLDARGRPVRGARPADGFHRAGRAPAGEQHQGPDRPSPVDVGRDGGGVLRPWRSADGFTPGNATPAVEADPACAVGLDLPGRPAGQRLRPTRPQQQQRIWRQQRLPRNLGSIGGARPPGALVRPCFRPELGSTQTATLRVRSTRHELRRMLITIAEYFQSSRNRSFSSGTI